MEIMEIIEAVNYLWIFVVHILYAVHMDIGGSGGVGKVREANVGEDRRVTRTGMSGFITYHFVCYLYGQ